MPKFKTPEYAEIGKRKSRCRGCFKIIINKEPRLKRFGIFKEYYYSYYYCSKCGKKVIENNIITMKDEIKRLRKMDKELNKLKEKNKDIMILSNLENQNGKTKR